MLKNHSPNFLLLYVFLSIAIGSEGVSICSKAEGSCSGGWKPFSRVWKPFSFDSRVEYLQQDSGICDWISGLWNARGQMGVQSHLNQLFLSINEWEYATEQRFLSPVQKAKDCREVGNRDRKQKDLRETESVQNLQCCSAGCCMLRTQKEVPTHCHSKMLFCHA